MHTIDSQPSRPEIVGVAPPHIKNVIDALLVAYSELRRSLSRRLGNQHDAADVAQSSFENVYARALATPVASPRALLFRTAQNLCIDRERRRQIEVRVLKALEVTGPAAVPSAEHVCAARQAVARIAARLARLPGKRREVFVLARVYGYTHAEIAARLSLTLAAVEKHVVRATLDCSGVFAAVAPE